MPRYLLILLMLLMASATSNAFKINEKPMNDDVELSVR